MRFTYLVDKDLPPPGGKGRTLGTPLSADPKFPDTGDARNDPARPTGESATPAAAGPNGRAGLGRLVGLSSPDPRHPRFTAISWVVLQEVKHDAAAALLRLELLRRQHPEPAIARAIEFLRCTVGELEALASGESDEADGRRGE